MSLTGTDYRRYDAKRACDICGHLWHKSELTRIAPFRWACPDDVAGLTAEDISRHNASVRPLMVKAVKNAKGLSQTPIYQQAEGEILNLVLDKAPNSVFLSEAGSLGGQQDSANGLADRSRALGWFCIYLSNLVLENRRPTRWITQAQAKLVTLADLIVAGQRTTTAFSPATDGLEYGAVYVADSVPSTYVLDVPGNGACLLGLLGAYRATGATKYIIAARRLATFLRRAQCFGNFSNFYGIYSAAARVAIGPFPDTLKVVASTSTNANPGFYGVSISGLVCAWALNALRLLDGDASYGGGAASIFTSDQAGLLSAAVNATVSWWQNGAPDSDGSTVVGFSSTTPKSSYATGANGGFLGVSSWATQSYRGFEYAMGLRALFEIGGYTAQVSSIYEWLRSFSADPANAASTDREQREKSTLGTYDPTLALAWSLNVTALTEGTDSLSTVYSSPGYDWRTVGILAPIQSSRARSEFAVAKDELSKPRSRRFMARLTGAGVPSNTVLSRAAYDRVQLYDSLPLLAFSGLSFQTSVGLLRTGWSGLLFGHYVDLVGAVQAADVYRYPPQAFPLAQG